MSREELSRRAFLGSGVAGGALAAADLAWPARRAGALTAPRPPVQAPFELEEMTVLQLQEGMRAGRWTARSLAEQYLARIEELDQRGPALHTIIELNPDALAIAGQMDAERASKGPRGPLHGIPVLIKDNIATRDHMMTTAGSLALVGAVPPKEAFVARRLREELRSVLAGRDLAPEDVEKLAYTKAVVEEAMRLYPPVAAITREALHDDEIGGFHIPARTTVMISPWVSHRNPRFWPAPEAFDPDRFLPGSVERPRLAYLPFGAGPRQCLGTGFALQEMVIALGVLAARFEPALVPGQRVEPQFGVSVRPRHGVSMTIHDAE